MKIWREQLHFQADMVPIAYSTLQDALFFDIETTGFSPSHSQLYMIGCAYLIEDKLEFCQFFADTKEEEAFLLQQFLDLLKNYHTLIHFHGLGFDIPYIKGKCEIYHIEEPFTGFSYIDLYKIASSLKFLLQLPDYKQKTMEQFLGIHRKDPFSGGELIEIYKEYQKNPNDKLLGLLKQHNFEDVLGMTELLSLLFYQNFFNGDFTIQDVTTNAYIDFHGKEQKELIFTLRHHIPIKHKLSYDFEGIYLLLEPNYAKLTIPVFEGELKYYLKDYKNYYYLPEEDIVIHKSLATYVDKNYKQKATAENCFIKKNAPFLPQFLTIYTPFFSFTNKDKKTFFELNDDFLNHTKQQAEYLEHILATMYKKNEISRKKSVP